MANYVTPANSQEVDFGAFYNDVYAPYANTDWDAFWGGVAQSTPTIRRVQTVPISGPIDYTERLPSGNGPFPVVVTSPGGVQVGPENMTQAEIDAGLVNSLVNVPLPRRRPNTGGTMTATNYTPSEAVLGYAPELSGGNPSFEFKPPTAENLQLAFDGLWARPGAATNTAANNVFTGLLQNLATRIFGANSGVQVQNGMVSIPLSGLGDMMNVFGNPEFMSGAGFMSFLQGISFTGNTGKISPSITQEQIVAANVGGLLNPDAYEALSAGKSSYSSGGAVLPTTSMNGQIRNSYGDTGGSIASDYGTSFNTGSIATSYKGKK